MAGNAETVDPQALGIDGAFARALAGIAMDERLRGVLAHQGCQSGDVLAGAQFVIGELQADDAGLFVQRRDQLPLVHQPLAVHRQAAQFVTLLRRQGAQDRGVIDARRHHIASWLIVTGIVDGEVIGLGAAGGEDNAGGAATQVFGDARLGRVQAVAGGLAVFVDGAGIAPFGLLGVQPGIGGDLAQGVVAFQSR